MPCVTSTCQVPREAERQSSAAGAPVLRLARSPQTGTARRSAATTRSARLLGALNPGFATVPQAGARAGVWGGPLGSGGPRSRLCRAPGRGGDDGPLPRGPSGSRQVAATESAAGACPQRPPDGDALVPVSYKSSPIWGQNDPAHLPGGRGEL